MRAVRLAARLLLLSIATLLCLVVLALGALPALLGGRLGIWRARVTGWWSRLVLSILSVQLEVVGSPPRGTYLLVSNHLSYVDIPVLAACIPCTFVSKSEVKSWPVLGPLSRLAGTIYVDRGRRRDVVRVGTEIEGALRGGQRVVFFPEGTSTAGEEVAPFRSSLLDPAAVLGLPVHFAVLRYETPESQPPASLSVAWWGDMDFAPHLLQLLSGPGFRARVEFGEEPVRDRDRKSLALRLHGAVSARFLPMPSGGTSCTTSHSSPAGT